MTGACLVLTSTDSEPHARVLIDAVLSANLAACVQMMPIRSFYVWQGETHDTPEQLLIFKARRDDWAALADTIRAHHTYDTPDIICLDMAAADQAYLAWVMRRGG